MSTIYFFPCRLDNRKSETRVHSFLSSRIFIFCHVVDALYIKNNRSSLRIPKKLMEGDRVSYCLPKWQLLCIRICSKSTERHPYGSGHLRRRHMELQPTFELRLYVGTSIIYKTMFDFKLQRKNKSYLPILALLISSDPIIIRG